MRALATAARGVALLLCLALGGLPQAAAAGRPEGPPTKPRGPHCDGTLRPTRSACPIAIAAAIGFPQIPVVGVYVSYHFWPVLAAELTAGALTTVASASLGLRYEPLGRRSDLTPYVGGHVIAGNALELSGATYDKLVAFGAALGLSWRHRSGFDLTAQIQAASVIEEDAALIGGYVSLGGRLTIGGAF